MVIKIGQKVSPEQKGHRFDNSIRGQLDNEVYLEISLKSLAMTPLAVSKTLTK